MNVEESQKRDVALGSRGRRRPSCGRGDAHNGDSHDPEEPGRVPRPRSTVGQVHTCMRRRTYEAVGSRNAALRRAMRRRDKPRVTMRQQSGSKPRRTVYGSDFYARHLAKTRLVVWRVVLSPATLLVDTRLTCSSSSRASTSLTFYDSRRFPSGK